MNLQEIDLKNLKPDIFSDIAKNAAEFIKPRAVYDERQRREVIRNRDANKSTQLRKLYDELAMWDDKIHRQLGEEKQKEEYEKSAPFIHMLKAKVAYAKGREHVNEDFLNLFNHMIGQIDSPKTLRHAKLFFEAVIAFRKASE